MPRLHTGEEVPSDSEAWRAECEARHVLRLPQAERMEYLRGRDAQPGQDAVRGVLQIRGQAAVQELADRMRSLRDAYARGWRP